MNPNLSSGPDGVPGVIVADCRYAFLKPMKHIFALILESSTFPDAWKISRLVPVYKKGDRSDISNYRPIAILNNFCKIFEFCLHQPIMEHVRDSISSDQHGFMPGRSTTTNLFVITQFISDHLDKMSQVDVIYTDFSQAFDRLDHKLLLSKIRRFYLSNRLINLLESYLSNRRQFVENAGIKSKSFQVRSGVPQGSVLGPLLFNLFIDDITSIFSAECLIYADDMKLFSSVSSIEDCLRLQADLAKLQRWCVVNHLHLNVGKCNVVSFHRTKKPILFNYQINEEILSRPEVISDLGVIFDSDLSFNIHINSTVNRCYKTMGFIIRSGRGFSTETLMKLFNAYIRSRLEYACPIWSPTYAVHVKELETILRKFLKFLSYLQDGVYPEIGFPQESLLHRFNLVTLEQRRHYHLIMFLHKTIGGHINCPAISRQLAFSVPRPGARHQTLFYLPFARTRSQQSSPLHNMCRIYHSVQNQLDIMDTTAAGIKSYFLSQ